MSPDGEWLDSPNDWLNACPTQEARDELFEILASYLDKPGATLTDAHDERMRDLIEYPEGCYSYIYDLEIAGYLRLPRFAKAAAALGPWTLHQEAMAAAWAANPYGHKIQAIRDLVGELVAAGVRPARRR